MNTIDFYSQFNGQSQISREEEKQLIKRAEKGDKKAKDKLVLGNLKFASYMAKKSKFSKLEQDDLINECVCGLVKAANHVNSKYDNHFITYANLWVKNSIDNANNTSGDGVRLPEQKFRMMRKCRGIYSKFMSKYDDDIKSRRLAAEEMGLSLREFNEILNISENVISLDGIFENSDQDGRSYEDVISSFKEQSFEDKIIESDARKCIREIVNRLPAREADVLIKHFGLNGDAPMSFAEIGDSYGLTKSWANDLEKKARRSLMNYADELQELIA